MKTAFKSASAIALSAMLFGGCQWINDLETKFLTVESIGKSTIASFFEEVSGVAAAGEGLNHDLEDFLDNQYMKYADITGESLNINTVSAGEGDYYLYNFEMKTEYVATYPRTLWGKGWGLVTDANNIIYYADKLHSKEGLSATDVATIDKCIAWGYFVRAFAHFCICNCYAQPYCFTADASHIGIPVVSGPLGFEDQIARQSVHAVYEQILSDLDDAYAILNSYSGSIDYWHISATACEALYARVYLYMQDWDNAAKYAKMVMDKKPLAKRAEYIDMFRNPFKSANAETILRMNQYDGSSTLVSCYDPTRSGGNDFYPCPSMSSKYESDDIRLELLTYVPEDCETDAVKGKTYSAVCKHCAFKSIADSKERIPCPFVFRVSEMYLIHAEAVANGSAHDLAAAAADIKALEARARGVDASAVSLSYSDLAALNKIIHTERVKELCYEGHSLFDNIRRGEDLVRPADCNSKIKTLKFGDYRTVLPIDQMELQANDNMVNNEGY